MARKICTAGVVGPFSFMVLENDVDSVTSAIRGERSEIVTHHTGREIAEQWTERKLRELIGIRYEAD